MDIEVARVRLDVAQASPAHVSWGPGTRWAARLLRLVAPQRLPNLREPVRAFSSMWWLTDSMRTMLFASNRSSSASIVDISKHSTSATWCSSYDSRTSYSRSVTKPTPRQRRRRRRTGEFGDEFCVGRMLDGGPAEEPLELAVGILMQREVCAGIRSLLHTVGLAQRPRDENAQCDWPCFSRYRFS